MNMPYSEEPLSWEIPVEEPASWWNHCFEYTRRLSGFQSLFLGVATDLWTGYGPRKVQKRQSNDDEKYALIDSPSYNVFDVRMWSRNEPKPLFLDSSILNEHCYIMGPSGSGKTSLGIITLLIQLIRGRRGLVVNEEREKRPIVVFDLKGDLALFNTVREEAHQNGQKFLFFTPEKNAPTFRFNPFKGFNRNASSTAQFCQLILDALSLNHGKGYGRGYYTQRSRQALSSALKDFPRISSFRELLEDALPQSLSIRCKTDKRARVDAFELASVIETLDEYDQLVTLPNENDAEDPSVIYMPRVLRDREVVYFWLPAALESISVGEIAKLALFNLRVAAQDWKRNNPVDARQTVLVIDEFQHLAGENLRGVLQDARSFGIGAILANQGLHDLKTSSGFDLGPAVMANTCAKMFFTTPSKSDCYVYVERSSGRTTLAQPYPKTGNPFLKDLAPEEFAYHVKMTWPVSREEYSRRECVPLPGWAGIPGEGSWVEKIQKQKAARKAKDAHPHPPASFPAKDDSEAKRQKEKLGRLFGEDL